MVERGIREKEAHKSQEIGTTNQIEMLCQLIWSIQERK